ncbi:tRNA wybutosine-synthesizing protein 3 homolog [Crassostrea virginica]
MSSFDREKERALTGVDLSRKGSIDARIHLLVSLLNGSNDFFTTSSCSGRIIIFDDNSEEGRTSVKKKGCQWLYTTHDEAHYDAAIASLRDLSGDSVFKFEPFVLHVQCKSLSNAQSLLSCAVASGFRNSGISIGNKGKIIVAVRSTHSLEVPLSQQGELLVTEKYIGKLVQIANQKMQENFLRIDRFFGNVETLLERLKNVELCENESSNKNLSTKKTRRKQHKKVEILQSEGISLNKLTDRPTEEMISDDLSGCSLFDDVT